MLYVPLDVVLSRPSSVALSKRRTTRLAVTDPPKLGVLSLVRLSVALEPVSVVRSGATVGLDGATVSMVIARPGLDALTFPATSSSVNVIVRTPSASAATVMDQLVPIRAKEVVVTSTLLAKTVMMEVDSELPEKVGVASFVILSEWL